MEHLSVKLNVLTNHPDQLSNLMQILHGFTCESKQLQHWKKQ